MIDAKAFLDAAARHGFDFFTGVPCSFLTPLINRTISDPALRYVGATSEGEAVAIAAGAWLAGRNTVVMCQNSGLGNAVNPLTSLNFPFRIPSLLVVTWRGQPTLEDEPQHELMGGITGRLLDTIKVGHRMFPAEAADIEPALEEAHAALSARDLPFAMIMEKGAVADEGLDEPAPEPFAAGRCEDLRRRGVAPSRFEALRVVLDAVPEHAAIIATTGKCGRELFTLADRRQHLYVVGSMGCASALGLGVSLNVDRPVIVLDGDGAALMKLGNMATIGALRPRNLVHVVLDNGMHDSTGGQKTVASVIDFASVALACGYAYAADCDEPAGFGEALSRALAANADPGGRFIHLRLSPGTLPDLGRPSVGPPEVARRFRAFLAEG